MYINGIRLPMECFNSGNTLLKTLQSINMMTKFKCILMLLEFSNCHQLNFLLEIWMKSIALERWLFVPNSFEFFFVWFWIILSLTIFHAIKTQVKLVNILNFHLRMLYRRTSKLGTYLMTWLPTHSSKVGVLIRFTQFGKIIE